MRIRHIANGIEVEKEASNDQNSNINNTSSFLLTNMAGSYAWMNSNDSCQPISNYQGVFFFTKAERMFRIIENINPVNAGKITQINNYFRHVERIRENIKETIAMPPHFSALAYTTDKKTMLEIVLDIKEPYDSRSSEKYDEIYKEKEKIIIEFTKKTDNKEDNSHEEEEYTLFLVIASKDKPSYKIVENWFERYYPWDEKRKTMSKRWVFHALNIETANLVFAFSGNKSHAIKEAKYLIKNFNHLFNQHNTHAAIPLDKLPDDNTRMAYLSALYSLHSLSVLNHGLFAGLPWFFQFWTRDTAISSKALMLEHKEKYAKKILFQYLSHIGADGRMANRIPSSELGSADGIGWVFRRLYDLLKKHKLSKKEKARISERLHHAIYLLLKYRTEDGFAVNQSKETWMDTDNLGDKRSGARIEIQALRLSMYNLMSDFYDNGKYLKLEQRLKRAIKKRFWNEKYLNDGIDNGVADTTIRPNIFLSAYIFPAMLSTIDWKLCFDSILPKLWLNWGGFSTIDKKSPIFQKYHTGQENTSYHHGDSWYFLNNMAAIVLQKADSEKYKHYVNRILKASADEILWQGAIGHHSEISSAEERESSGCQAQLWSAAMFVELVHKLYS